MGNSKSRHSKSYKAGENFEITQAAEEKKLDWPGNDIEVVHGKRKKRSRKKNKSSGRVKISPAGHQNEPALAVPMAAPPLPAVKHAYRPVVASQLRQRPKPVRAPCDCFLPGDDLDICANCGRRKGYHQKSNWFGGDSDEDDKKDEPDADSEERAELLVLMADTEIEKRNFTTALAYLDTAKELAPRNGYGGKIKKVNRLIEISKIGCVNGWDSDHQCKANCPKTVYAADQLYSRGDNEMSSLRYLEASYCFERAKDIEKRPAYEKKILKCKRRLLKMKRKEELQRRKSNRESLHRLRRSLTDEYNQLKNAQASDNISNEQRLKTIDNLLQQVPNHIFEEVVDDWTCGLCTFQNRLEVKVCEVCAKSADQRQKFLLDVIEVKTLKSHAEQMIRDNNPPEDTKRIIDQAIRIIDEVKQGKSIGEVIDIIMEEQEDVEDELKQFSDDENDLPQPPPFLAPIPPPALPGVPVPPAGLPGLPGLPDHRGLPIPALPPPGLPHPGILGPGLPPPGLPALGLPRLPPVPPLGLPGIKQIPGQIQQKRKACVYFIPLHFDPHTCATCELPRRVHGGLQDEEKLHIPRRGKPVIPQALPPGVSPAPPPPAVPGPMPWRQGPGAPPPLAMRQNPYMYPPLVHIPPAARVGGPPPAAPVGGPPPAAPLPRALPRPPPPLPLGPRALPRPPAPRLPPGGFPRPPGIPVARPPPRNVILPRPFDDLARPLPRPFEDIARPPPHGVNVPELHIPNIPMMGRNSRSQSNLALKASDFKTACASLEELPDEAVALRLLADDELDAGNHEEAIKRYKQALEVHKRNNSKDKAAEKYIADGDMRLSQSDYSGAIDSYNRALDMVPDNQTVKNRLIAAQEVVFRKQERERFSPTMTISTTLSPNPMAWSENDVCTWLKSVGFEAYVDLFRDNLINGAMLMDLNATDLHELSIGRKLVRRRFMKERNHLTSQIDDQIPAKFELYYEVLRAILVDQHITIDHEMLLSEMRQKHDISDAQHETALQKLGISLENFNSMKNSSNHQDTNECVICLDTAVDHIVVPCFHLCLCAACAPEIERVGICPQCRTSVEYIKKVYS